MLSPVKCSLLMFPSGATDVEYRLFCCGCFPDKLTITRMVITFRRHQRNNKPVTPAVHPRFIFLSLSLLSSSCSVGGEQPQTLRAKNPEPRTQVQVQSSPKIPGPRTQRPVPGSRSNHRSTTQNPEPTMSTAFAQTSVALPPVFPPPQG